MRKCLSLLLCLALMLSTSSYAMAATVFTADSPDRLPAGQPGAYAPRASNIPETEGSLPYNATISNLMAGYYTYTKYYFKPGDSTLRILGTMYSCSGNTTNANCVEFQLYQKGNSEMISRYQTEKFESGGMVAHTFENLKPAGEYFFVVKNVCDNATGKYSAVEGEFLID